MGISLETSGIKVKDDKCFLVNLNADPALNELLVYYLKVLTASPLPLFCFEEVRQREKNHSFVSCGSGKFLFCFPVGIKLFSARS